jgi:hypothetical protein
MLTTVVTELSENVNNGQNLHALEDLVYENGVIDRFHLTSRRPYWCTKQ